MSSEIQERFENLQCEFQAYADHIMMQAPQSKSKSRAKQEPAVVSPPSPVSVSTAAPRTMGRKPKLEEAVVAAPVAC